MFKGRWVLAVLFCSVLACGCSWTRVRPLQSFDDKESAGVRFYSMRPYLLVTDDGTEIVYLPDYTRGYRVTWGSLLCKVKQEVELENGVALKSSGSEIDCTSFLGALGEIFKGAGAEAVKGAVAAGARTQGKFKALYELTFDEKTGKLVGMREVPLPKAEK